MTQKRDNSANTNYGSNAKPREKIKLRVDVEATICGISVLCHFWRGVFWVNVVSTVVDVTLCFG